jgi:outer membrane protein assembly factor BamA
MLLAVKPAAAVVGMETEEEIARMIVSKRHTPDAEVDRKSRKWALLPQAGYGPETGALGGLKFVNRDLLRSGFLVDIGGFYAIKKQQKYSLAVGTDQLFNDRLLLFLTLSYALDPQQEFFGIGNNDVGPDPVSRHAIQDAQGRITVGWRLRPRLILSAQFGTRHVRIWCDEGGGDAPCTLNAFQDLPGIDGGRLDHLAISLVWCNRTSLVRPTRGWRVILKGKYTDDVFLGDYDFIRFVGDASYLFPLFAQRLILAMRVNGQWITGAEGDTPFWELANLGGNDTLRGFFPNRFLGRGSVLLGGELRGGVTEFDFFNLWRVRIDGVLFGEGGRVFIDEEDVSEEFRLDSEILTRVVDDLRYSYGAGLRIALSQSLVARIDAAFSEEERGLVYLQFGHTF